MGTLADRLKKHRREEQEIRGYANSSRWYTGLSHAISFLERAETSADPLGRFMDTWAVAYNLFMMHGEPGDEEFRRFNSWVSSVTEYAGVRHHFVARGDTLLAFRQSVERVKNVLLKPQGLQELDAWSRKSVVPEKACRYFLTIARDIRNTVGHPGFNPTTPVKKAISAAADCLLPIVAAAVEATIEHPIPNTTGRATAYRFFLYPFLKNSDGFFSDYYLERLFPDEELEAFPEEQAKEHLKRVSKEMEAREPALRAADASQTVSQWLEPVLFDVLGIKPSTGVRIIGTEAVFEPSSVLPKAGHSKKALGDVDGKDASKALSCLIWTLPWRTSLDSVATEPPFAALPITEIVHRALAASDVPWAIITNGRQFRLLSRLSSYKPRCFLEADLVALLDRKTDRQALRAFRFVLGLFSGRCFTDVDEAGQTVLDRVAEGSDRHGKEIGDELKSNVFSALRDLGEGFLDHLRANPAPTNEWRDTRAPGMSRERFLTSDVLLGDIYHESLSLMYRLLFLFYAESRELLPLDNELYQTYSLESIRDDVHSVQDDPDPKRFFAKGNTDLWARLKELFRFLDKGWGNVIPPYNGGLFDPEKHEFLARFAVGDYYLARAIDLLSRTKPRIGQNRGEGRKKVTYRDLDVRHLGSIYEGILEYTAHIADQEYLVLRQGSGTTAPEEYLAVAELSRDQKLQLAAWKDAVAENPENPRVPRSCKVSGQVATGHYYLVFGGRESKRKSSGSYYTPDYIVQYIVENTLGPIVRGECRAKPELPERELKTPISKQSLPKTGPLTSREVLEIKVLDPAMGSGHFLVAATEFLARAYRDALLSEGARTNEVKADQDFVRYKRIIAERCIYGVDLNPMAVELAKLSMWLFTMDPGRPLSFVDHHLKCGNALLGARIRQLGSLPDGRAGTSSLQTGRSGQINLFEPQFQARVPIMLRDVFQITSKETATPQDVADKKLLDQAIEALKLPFTSVADAWLSSFFDDSSYDYLHMLSNVAAIRGSKSPIASRHRFFHWEIEFPEVFFHGTGSFRDDPGFNAILGNPPWGAAFSSEQKTTLKRLFDDFHMRTPESSLYFIGSCWNIIRRDGLVGLILPSSVLNQHEFSKARKLIVQSGHVERICNLGDGVFTQVTSPCCLLFFGASSKLIDPKYCDLKEVDRRSLPATLVSAVLLALKHDDIIAQESYSFLLKSGTDIIRQCAKWPSLRIYAEDVATGISSGLDVAYVYTQEQINELHLERPLLRKLIVGGEIHRYYLSPASGKKILYVTATTEIDSFPSARAALVPYRKQLMKRREAANGTIPWYCLNWPRRPKLFDSPKILIRQTADQIIAAYDPDGWYCLKSGIIVQLPEGATIGYYYLLGILNSKLMRFVYEHMVGEEGRIFPEVKPVQLFKLPIRSIDRSNPSDVRAHDEIEGIVSSLIAGYQRLSKSGRPVANSIDQESIRKLEARVDRAVFRLYGVVEGDVETIESMFEEGIVAAD